MKTDARVKAISAPEQLDLSIEAPIGGALKRGFDVVFSATALLSLLPVMLVICLLLRVMSNGPVFFVHRRIGFDGKAFGCIKFRTMVPDADTRLATLLATSEEARDEFARTRKLKNDPRIIPVIGSFLRSTSLDELPQFFNVLCGQMSVVGPRPVTAEELENYGVAKASYVSARPGITGLWQVSGRNETTFNERVAIDKTYVQRWSLSQDIGIIWRTCEVVLRREGAY